MTIASMEYIEKFHETGGRGLNAAPIVEAALLAHELLAVLKGIRIETEGEEGSQFWIVFSPSGGGWAGHAGIPIAEDDPFRLLIMKAWDSTRRAAIAKATLPGDEAP